MRLRILPKSHRLRQGKVAPQGHRDVNSGKGAVCKPRKSNRCLLNSDDDDISPLKSRKR